MSIPVDNNFSFSDFLSKVLAESKLTVLYYKYHDDAPYRCEEYCRVIQDWGHVISKLRGDYATFADLEDEEDQLVTYDEEESRLCIQCGESDFYSVFEFFNITKAKAEELKAVIAACRQ